VLRGEPGPGRARRHGGRRLRPGRPAEAVGDEKVTYWGISYGPLVGSTYAQIFPDRARTMVFDGNMRPGPPSPGSAKGRWPLMTRSGSSSRPRDCGASSTR
jgi:pimeloyl-ACP methyl ester carboxylesterase